MLADAHRQAAEDIEKTLDSETQALVKDIIDLLLKRHSNVIAVILYGSVARHEERPLAARYPSDVDLLVILDSDDLHIALSQGDALFHTLGLASSLRCTTRSTGNVFFAHLRGVGSNFCCQCHARWHPSLQPWAASCFLRSLSAGNPFKSQTASQQLCYHS